MRRLRDATAGIEHGGDLLNLDIGLPTDRRRLLIRHALADGGDPQELRVSATNRRGRTIGVRVVCYRWQGTALRRAGQATSCAHDRRS